MNKLIKSATLTNTHSHQHAHTHTSETVQHWHMASRGTPQSMLHNLRRTHTPTHTHKHRETRTHSSTLCWTNRWCCCPVNVCVTSERLQQAAASFCQSNQPKSPNRSRKRNRDRNRYKKQWQGRCGARQGVPSQLSKSSGFNMWQKRKRERIRRSRTFVISNYRTYIESANLYKYMYLYYLYICSYLLITWW